MYGLCSDVESTLLPSSSPLCLGVSSVRCVSVLCLAEFVGISKRDYKEKENSWGVHRDGRNFHYWHCKESWLISHPLPSQECSPHYRITADKNHLYKWKKGFYTSSYDKQNKSRTWYLCILPKYGQIWKGNVLKCYQVNGLSTKIGAGKLSFVAKLPLKL